MLDEFNACRKLFEKSASFVLTTHINPDGDGLGSEVALATYLDRLGKQTHIINHSSTPPFYQFLDPAGRIHQYEPDRHNDTILSADVILVLDTNHPDRLHSMKFPVLQSRATTVCIDHHLDAGKFADLYLLDDNSVATGEIVYRLLVYLQGPALSTEIATALYTAIMTDTGSFRFPKTSAETHRQIAHLIDCGADPVAIYNQVYDQATPNKLKLLGAVLGTLQLEHDGRVAVLYVSRKMFQETSTSEVDTDNMINYTLTIKGVQIGVMVTELEDALKIGFRSKGDIWINKLAQEFGGNGHKHAAGARVQNLTLEQLLPMLIERSKRYTM